MHEERERATFVIRTHIYYKNLNLYAMYVHVLFQDGNQPIHIAAANGCEDIIEYLVKELDPNLIDATVLVCILLLPVCYAKKHCGNRVG